MKIRIYGPLHGKPMTLERDVTKSECPWLKADLPKGTVVYYFDGETYDCLTDEGMPVTLTKEDTQFWEVPRSAVVPDERTH